MTRILKYLGIAAAMTLILACFLPWVNIHGNLTVKGVDTTGTNFGKPGYLHLVFALFFLAFTLIQRLWAKRFNLLVIVFKMTAFIAVNVGDLRHGKDLAGCSDLWSLS